MDIESFETPYDGKEPEELGSKSFHREPPDRYAFDVLKSSGELDFGKEIKWTRLEELFGRLRDLADPTWAFIYMGFGRMAKGEGYFLSQDGMHQRGVRVLLREEIAEEVKRRELKKANDSLRNSLAMSAVPRLGMDEKEAKKLDYWEMKAAEIGAASKRAIRQRTISSPTSTPETVQQVLARGSIKEDPEE